MAIYHFTANTISRNENNTGRTAVAAAAYRNGERYVGIDNRVANYKNKAVSGFELVYPRYVKDKPSAMQLWRSADIAELKADGSFKKSSRSAREFEFSLPVELTPQQNKLLARDFARAFAEQYGVACNLSYHMLSGSNPHCHMMFTVRKIEADGALSDKIRDLDRKEMLLLARQRWAEFLNTHLARAGFNIELSEKSFKDQQIEHEPVKRINFNKLKRAERLGIELEEIKINKEIMQMRQAALREKRNIDSINIEMLNQAMSQTDKVSFKSKPNTPGDEYFERYNRAMNDIGTQASPIVEPSIELQLPAIAPDYIAQYKKKNGQNLKQSIADDFALLALRDYINQQRQQNEIELRRLNEYCDKIKKAKNTKIITSKFTLFGIGFGKTAKQKYSDVTIQAYVNSYQERLSALKKKMNNIELIDKRSGLVVLADSLDEFEQHKEDMKKYVSKIDVIKSYKAMITIIEKENPYQKQLNEESKVEEMISYTYDCASLEM